MNSREDIIKEINTYISDRNIKTNLLFWVPGISLSKGPRLRQNISYKISNADYIVQYYKLLDLIVVWKNTGAIRQSYNKNTILKNLEEGKVKDYKGEINHFRNKTLVYFSTRKHFPHILNLIFN